jgi:hypothetical protein
MRKSLLFFASVLMTVMMSGCAKYYSEVTTEEYATLELLPKSETLFFADAYYAHIYDYSKGCDGIENLGTVYTDSDTPKSVKIPVGTPLMIRVNYQVNQSHNYLEFVLTPEKHRHYVVEYVREEVDGKLKRDFSVYMLKGNAPVEIPSESIRAFNSRECS